MVASNAANINNVDKVELEKELKRLSAKTGYGANLELVIDSKINSDVEGEVIGNKIVIHSVTREHALETLRHEFIDALVVESIKPYQDLVNLHRTVLNSVLKHLQEGAYAKKEQSVESLLRLME